MGVTRNRERRGRMKPLGCISNGEKSSNLNEPIFDIAHLAHVELLTPGPKGMLWYFKDLFRMRSPVPDSVCSYGTPAGQEQLVLAEAATDLSSGVRPARARVDPKP